MLRLVDRNKQTDLDVFKRLDNNGNCLGYVVGKLSTVNKNRLIKIAGGAATLSKAREIAGMIYTPPIKETVSESIHAQHQAEVRMKKPKRG